MIDMIRAYGSQNVRGGDGGRIKIRPYNMIRAYGSQGMRLKKVSTIFNHYLIHAKKFDKKCIKHVDKNTSLEYNTNMEFIETTIFTKQVREHLSDDA